jgi:hypothetical protein
MHPRSQGVIVQKIDRSERVTVGTVLPLGWRARHLPGSIGSIVLRCIIRTTAVPHNVDLLPTRSLGLKYRARFSAGSKCRWCAHEGRAAEIRSVRPNSNPRTREIVLESILQSRASSRLFSTRRGRSATSRPACLGFDRIPASFVTAVCCQDPRTRDRIGFSPPHEATLDTARRSNGRLNLTGSQCTQEGTLNIVARPNREDAVSACSLCEAAPLGKCHSAPPVICSLCRTRLEMLLSLMFALSCGARRRRRIWVFVGRGRR